MKKVKYEIYKGAKFTPKELDSIPYFIMINEAVDGDPRGFDYNYSEVCSYCHFGRALKSRLQISPSKLKKNRPNHPISRPAEHNRSPCPVTFCRATFSYIHLFFCRF